MKTIKDFMEEVKAEKPEGFVVARYYEAANRYGIYMQEQGYTTGFTHGQQSIAHEILDSHE